MKIEDLLLLFRKQVQDLSKPYLWDDVEVLQYLISAQDDLVRVIGGISDSTTRALCDVSVVPNIPFAKISPYILHITKGKLVTANRSIPIIGEADLAQQAIIDYGFPIQQSLDDEDTGRVDYAVIGLNDNKLRWLKVPETADTFRMHIYRLPYPRIVDSDSCLEVDEQHHIHLLMGMKALAYRKEDAETYDKTLAGENEANFARYCERARDEKQRQRHKPRTVQYGGI
jgi:hypothetical protein